MLRHQVRACWLAVVLAAGVANAAPPVRYRVVELPGLSQVPGSQYYFTGAGAINNRGAVVGNGNHGATGNYEEDRFRPLRWDGAVRTELPIFPGTYGLNAGCSAINDAGLIVGWGPFQNDPFMFLEPHAMAWVNGSPVDLGAPAGHTWSLASAVNSSDVIVGGSGAFNFSPWSDFPVRWVGGQVQQLPCPIGLMFNGAADVNNDGTAVGWGFSLDPVYFVHTWEGRALRWDVAGALTLLPLRDGDIINQAAAINNRGQIGGDSGRMVDVYFDPTLPPEPWYFPHAVVWDGATIRTLGELPGDDASTVIDINDAGTAIGGSGILDLTVSLDFLYTPTVWAGGEPHDFHDLIDPSTPGWTITRLNAINNRGVIVGIGQFQDRYAAFMATPVYGK